MCMRRCLVGLTFCTCYLASYLTNKYVLSVLKFTYPTLFQGWQTLIGGLLLHVSWKLGWAEINSSSRSDVLTWLPASVLFVGIIYAGSRALSRLAIPVFLTLHNVAEVIICGHQKCFQKEKTSPAKICSALFLLAAAGCLPFNDSQFDPDGYFWAVVHLFCIGAYKILQKSQKPNALSDIDQQYLNYLFRTQVCLMQQHSVQRTKVGEVPLSLWPHGFLQEVGLKRSRSVFSTYSVVLLAFASHPTGDLLSVLDFPFLYFYRFHGSCCASGFLGFFLMVSTVKLKSLMTPGQCAAWIFFAKVITAGLSILLFDMILTRATVGWIS
ncbi:transmembrane protein 241 isoform X2 [Neophocaena asiaeorientalis asiaeorientalis]|uniref:Transmembrane protein 241 isoform X2 n=1 Tax=Neophocaena asiaeorientalis asiaeorientalis TaxID=1706337 RepID=A0A341CGP2_NEOAA|nr:transmembrane protein 241 isoform X2 [Neophocaena asiaeorientalis asiaeorientalis]